MIHISYVIDNEHRVDVNFNRLVIASWTGRDRDQLERRIAELAAVGVSTPSTVPCFYNVAATLLTSAHTIDVVGIRSTGEVEVVLIQDKSLGLLVGVGSDHTDRDVETYDVAISKQVCGKPISESLWKYEDVADHWDALVARSWRTNNAGERLLYQEGTLASLLQPKDLIRSVFGSEEMPFATALFCGTQTVIGDLSPAASLELELYDPMRNRSLRHVYSVEVLPQMK